MPYSNFLNDKQRFFTNANTKTTDSATKEAAAQDYAFLARNRSLIEQEFNDMFTSLKKNGQNSEQFWCYCGYLSLMLESYYRAYGKFAEAEKYRQYSEDIVNGKNQRAAAAQDDFLPRLQKKLAADLSKLASTPLHTSTIREWVSFINITRLQIVFCRLTVRESLLVAHQMHWLDRIGNAFGWPVDMDGIVSTLNTPTAMLNMLSVGVFAARFMINFGMLLKHTVVPSNDEKVLPWTERLSAEFWKRHPDFINDFVWGSVNGVTNYANYFNVSASAANGILTVFLIFDVAMNLYRRHLAEEEYVTKKAQYEEELKAAGSNEQRDMLNEQLVELDRQRQASCATNEFNVAAAGLFLGGYPVSFLLATPFAAPISFFVCSIAVAMYISAEMYGKYQEKSLILQQAQAERVQGNIDVASALSNMHSARHNLVLALTKNTLMPMFLITTVAVSAPAALLFTTLYIGYECGKGYFEQEQDSTHPTQIRMARS